MIGDEGVNGQTNSDASNLASYIDSVWTISSEGSINEEHNTIQGSNNRYLRSIDFRKVRMGAGERFVQLGVEKPAIVEYQVF